MIQYVDLVEDTICAPITAGGHAGVSVLRVSGDQALQMTRKLCDFLPELMETHKVYLGFLKDSSKNQKIDQVLITYFENGKSFTGDTVIEISCHGNPVIVNSILNQYYSMGCRSAEPGEFSFRAFYNGKMDLVQAESIQNIVTTKTFGGSEESLKRLSGDLSESFLSLENQMILAISHLEASIDFTEDDIDTADYGHVLDALEDVILVTNKLAESYHIGKNLNKGSEFLLLGPTNVGKSSLFNKIFSEEKAIVTDIAGTTRDLISQDTFVGTQAVSFIDSAGLRDSDDIIEQKGIGKTLEKVQDCQGILIVSDISNLFEKSFIKNLPIEKCFFVFNKMDLLDESRQKQKLIEIQQSFKKYKIPFKEEKCFFISAKTGFGIKGLLEHLKCYLEQENKTDDKQIVTQARHFNHLCALRDEVHSAKNLLILNESPDLISQRLQAGLMEIQNLLGKEYDDEILDKIFSEFCIGK